MIRASFDLVFTSFREEFLFRGLLLSGLLGLGLNTSHSNTIQAILFGLIHFHHYPELGVVSIIMTVAQMMVGFILGKLYLKTKSLTPSIIFHTLWNLFG